MFGSKCFIRTDDPYVSFLTKNWSLSFRIVKFDFSVLKFSKSLGIHLRGYGSHS